MAAAAAALALAAPASAASPDVVISEVYGGGGNSGATYTNDFIELYNRGADGGDRRPAGASSTPRAAGTSLAGHGARPARSPPARHYLVQEARGRGRHDAAARRRTPPARSRWRRRPARSRCHDASAADLQRPAARPAAGVHATSSATARRQRLEDRARAGHSATPRRHSAARGATDTDNNAADFTVGAPDPAEHRRRDPAAAAAARLRIHEIQGARTCRRWTTTRSSPTSPASSPRVGTPTASGCRTRARTPTRAPPRASSSSPARRHRRSPSATR